MIHATVSDRNILRSCFPENLSNVRPTTKRNIRDFW